MIHEGETLEEIKTRIQKKLHVPDEDFAKVCTSLSDLIIATGNFIRLLLLTFFLSDVIQWKFASVSTGRPDYLQDTDVVYNRFHQVKKRLLIL